MDNSDNFSTAGASPRERSHAAAAQLVDSLRQVVVEPTLSDNIARPGSNREKYHDYETAKRRGGVEAVREAVRNTRLSETVPSTVDTSRLGTAGGGRGRARTSVVANNNPSSEFGGPGGATVLPNDLMLENERKPPSWRMATSEAHQDYQQAKRESTMARGSIASSSIDPRDRRGSLHSTTSRNKSPKRTQTDPNTYHKRSSAATSASDGSGNNRSRSPKRTHTDPTSSGSSYVAPKPLSEMTDVMVGIGMDISALHDNSSSSRHMMEQDNSNQRREAEFSKLEPNGMDVSAISRNHHNNNRRNTEMAGSVAASDAQLKAGLRSRRGPNRASAPGFVSVGHNPNNRNSSPPRRSGGSVSPTPPPLMSQSEADARVKAGLRRNNNNNRGSAVVPGAAQYYSSDDDDDYMMDESVVSNNNNNTSRSSTRVVTSSGIPPLTAMTSGQQQQRLQYENDARSNMIRTQMEADAALKAKLRKGSQGRASSMIVQPGIVSSIPHSELRGGGGRPPGRSSVSVFSSGTNTTGTTTSTNDTSHSSSSKNPAASQAEADIRIKAGLRKSNRYSVSGTAASDDQDKILKAGLRRSRGGASTVPGAVPMTNPQQTTPSLTTTTSHTVDSDAQIKAGLRNNRGSMMARRSSHTTHGGAGTSSRPGAVSAAASQHSRATVSGLPLTQAEMKKFQRYNSDSADDDMEGHTNDSPYDDEPATRPRSMTPPHQRPSYSDGLNDSNTTAAARPTTTTTSRGLRNSVSGGNNQVDPAVHKFGMRTSRTSGGVPPPPGAASVSGTNLVAGSTAPVAGAAAVVDLEQGTNRETSNRSQFVVPSRRHCVDEDTNRYNMDDDDDIRVQGEHEIDRDISVRPMMGHSHRSTSSGSRIHPPPPVSGRYTNMAHTDTAYLEQQAADAAAHAIPLDHDHEKKDPGNKRSKKIYCIVVLVLAAIIGGVVGVVIGTKSSDDDGGNDPNANNNETGTSTTEAPGDGDMVPISQVFPTIDLLEDTIKAIESQRMTLPQVKAYKWLVEDPQGLDYSEAQRLQRFVLATFYYSTDGDNWFDDPQSNNWLNYASHECSWYSTAQIDTIMRINACNDYDPATSSQFDHHDFTALHLSGQFDRNLEDRVKGFLPPQLGLLTKLRVLNLGFQKLRRNIPSELGLLSNSLNRVVLYQNGLTGTIPTSLFTFVGSLWLSRNPFNNPTIPTEVGLNSKLESILLLDAGVVGTLPKELFQTGSNFNTFLMELNRLTGSIPTEIGLATRLQNLQLSKSKYSGEIPSELGLLRQLKQLDLAGNRLEGTICSELGNIVGLQQLNVMGNKLVGKVPTELMKLKQLRELKLSNTLAKTRGLTGQIPREYFTTTLPGEEEGEENVNSTTVATFPHLTHLWIEDTNMDVTIPTEIALMSKLVSIRMGMNRETPPWTLPSELGLLGLMNELTLQESKLFASIPSEFGRWQHMMLFDVANNDLTGTLPPQIGRTWRRPPLEWFGVYNNPGLSGPIPDQFCGILPEKFGCAAEPSAGTKANNLCGCNCGPCA